MQIELPSISDVAKADDIELREIMENAAKSTDDLIAQFKTASQFEETLPMCKFLGLDKQLKSIRGSQRWKRRKKFSWKNASRGKSVSFPKSRTTQNTTMAFEKTSGKGSPG